MNEFFGAENYKDYIPNPICSEHPEYNDIYEKAWELAFEHIKDIPNMPQTPYMDEAFCDTRIWIWDTCFMSLFCKYAFKVFPGVESLKNFYEVLHDGKKLPSVIATDKEPKFTGAIAGNSAEIKIQHADNPPLFAWVEYENALFSGDVERVKDLLYNKKYLQKHYEWFDSFKEVTKVDGVGMPIFVIAEKLGYKWEGGSSGMDNTPRGRTGEKAEEHRPNNPNMLWIDAICQQALSAKCISKLFELIGDNESAIEWQEKFNTKKELIVKYYWDETDKFFYDIDCFTRDFYKVKTIASFWALTAGAATEEQAKYMANELNYTATFGGKVPLISIARNDKDYNSNGRYWRGSLWLPTAYGALKGLADYGYYDEVHTAASKILSHMLQTYLNYTPHTIWECYSPEKCEPGIYDVNDDLARPDFCGWSALGPISIYIEFVLGFYSVNAFNKTVKWNKPADIEGEIGIKNLRFGDIVTDITAENNICTVISNEKYTLYINDKEYSVKKGINVINLIS